MSGVKIVLLCEDSQTESFVRNFLKHRRFKERDFEIRKSPTGSGAGEQWVSKQYPKELKAIRSKRDAYLIVVIDADTGSVDERHKQLETACSKEGIPPRDHRKDSNVLHIIPRRNIETWLAYLDGENVDESIPYPKLGSPGDCREHAESLYEMCHRDQNLREPVPPSLREACNEYRKFKKHP